MSSAFVIGIPPFLPLSERLVIFYNICVLKSIYTEIFYTKSQLLQFLVIPYAVFNSSLNLSAIIAINSEFVGFPFAADTVYPNIFSTA